MISAGLEGRLAYMTYPEPWRGPPKQHPEFLRPAPKPVTSRYNGVSSTSPNGTRLAPSQRSITKYPSPPTVPVPVNLTQHKDEVNEELPYSPYRLYTPTHFTHFPPFTTMYQTPYAHMMRPTFPTTPLPPLETYSPTTPTSITVSSTFLSPPSTFSPPSIKSGQSILRDKRTPPQPPPPTQQPNQQQQQQQHLNQSQVAFKVPSGKEGSLKHRILTRPEDSRCTASSSSNNNNNNNSHSNNVPLDLQKTPDGVRKRLNAATMSPPRSPKKSLNNSTGPGSFAKGMLIKLASGELRRIEDMRTEDFVNSAERCAELRLADSTVVKIEEKHGTGTVTITLSYNQRRNEVAVEAAVEHPFFVFGQGWASCNPDRTQQLYKLKVHRLQVGDIVISLTPREQFINLSLPSTAAAALASSSATSTSISLGAIQQLPRPPTIMTTATSTSMTSRQISVNPPIQAEINHNSNDNNNNNSNHQPINLQTHHHSSISPDSLAARKRRWSAPEICDDNDTMGGGATTIRRRID